MTDEHTQPEAEVEPKPRRFPTAFTVLAIVLLVVWGLSFVIPSGTYDINPKTGGPEPGTYHELPSCGDVPEGEACVDKGFVHQFNKLWAAPTNGLYGIENGKGNVDVDNKGFLYGAAQIFLFVLAIGAFISVTMKTGAIQTGIGRLAIRFRHSPAILIAVLMTVFAIGGTTEGMWEETLGFFALVVPLALALGFDRVTGAAIIFLGAGTGVLASTVNPFATGVASDAAGIDVGDGIGLRLVMWFVLVTIAIAFVTRYAYRVRADPSRSVMGTEGLTSGGLPMADQVVGDVPELTGRQKAILGLFFSAFAVMIYGFIPWGDIWDTVFNADFPLPTFTAFYFSQATMLFIVMAVVIGLIARLGEKGTVNAIVAGAGEFLGPALIIVVARAVTVIMKNSYITDTILHWAENAVTNASGGRVRGGGVHGEHADRVPGPVVVGACRPGDANPGAARRLRGRPTLTLGDGLPVGFGDRQLHHPDVGDCDGRPGAVEGRLRPLAALHPALLRGRVRRRDRVHVHRGGSLRWGSRSTPRSGTCAR